MNREREVERRRPLRQLDDVAARREDEDLVLIQIELQEFEELFGAVRVLLQLEQLPEPAKVLVELVEAGHLGQKTGRGFHTYPRPERAAGSR